MFSGQHIGATQTHTPPTDCIPTIWLADSLVPSPGDELPSPTEIRDAIMLEIAGTMMDTAFPAAEGPSEITMPFMFD